MRRVLRRKSDARRAAVPNPSLEPVSTGRRSSVPYLLTVPVEYIPERRGSYQGPPRYISRSVSETRSNPINRFILYGRGINYRRMIRVFIFMLIALVIVVLLSLYRLFTFWNFDKIQKTFLVQYLWTIIILTVKINLYLYQTNPEGGLLQSKFIMIMLTSLLA